MAYIKLKDTTIKSVCDAIDEKLFEMREAEGWRLEEDVIAEIIKDLNTSVFVNAFLGEISKEEDSEKALAKALLSLIYLVEREVEDPIKSYISYLLSSFGPVNKLFDKENTYLLINPDGKTLRWMDNQGRFTLLMHSSYWEPKFKEMHDRWESISKDEANGA